MKKIAMLIVGVTLLISPLLRQKEQTKQEAYSGTAIGTGGAVGAKSIGFDFRVNSYTSDEEVDQLATLLKEKGPDALRRAMEKLECRTNQPYG